MMLIPIIGAPAVGKSSIIRALFGKEYVDKPPNLIEPKPLFKCTEFH